MSVQLIDYTEKSIAVFGETEKIKDYLEKLGGKFNPGLTNKTTGSREAGWIFIKSKAKEVQKLVDGFNKGELNLNKETSILDVMMNKQKTVSKSTGDFVITKEMYMTLISRIERLETDNMNLSKLIISKKQPSTPSPTPVQSSSSSFSNVKNRVSTPVESDESDDSEETEEEEEYPTPKKSFLNFK